MRLIPVPHRPAWATAGSVPKSTPQHRWGVRLLVAIGLLAGSWLIGALVGGDTAAADPLGGQCPASVPRAGGLCRLAAAASPEHLTTSVRQVAKGADAGRPASKKDSAAPTGPMPDVVRAGKRALDTVTQTKPIHRTIHAVTTRRTPVQSITAPLTSTARRVTDELPGLLGAAQSISNEVLPVPLATTDRPLGADTARSVTAPPISRSHHPPPKVAPTRADRPIEARCGKAVAAPVPAPRPHKSGATNWTTDAPQELPSPATASSCTPLAPVGDGTLSQAGAGAVIALAVHAGRVVPRTSGGPPRARWWRSQRSMADLPTVFPD
ncbi:hypothetical protein L3Q65_22735 [Amycolatopsis sp. FU40]|uniref:hypothetical protein n=1 Tax=Amycolatopsis sp. FU40 TaxID=2914159 RepID=UPI001F207568|nr:hypothetical protein [Amycolatopsis sp. FU40]UKD59417.1 hypothetical protein L3Q65_22735 [Amycolatopsis sp. FU40]